MLFLLFIVVNIAKLKNGFPSFIFVVELLIIVLLFEFVEFLLSVFVLLLLFSELFELISPKSFNLLVEKRIIG